MFRNISMHLGLFITLSTHGWAEKPDGPLLVLPEAKRHRMVLIDPRVKKVVGQVAVPGWPHEVVFSQNGKTAYLPSYSDAIVGVPGNDGQTIDIVDMNTRTVTQTWDLKKQLRPHMAILGGDGTLLVSTELAQAITVIDLKDGRITGQIPTGAKESHVFARTSDGSKIYTANLHAGSISVLDARARKLIKLIQISGLVNRIALSTDGKRLFVTDGDSPNVIVIDTATDEVIRKAVVSAPPFSVFPTPDGKWLLVGEDLGTKGKLEVIDLQNLAVSHTFDVDRLPFGIRVVDSEAFVACYLSGNLDVLNLADWSMEPPILNVAHGDGLAIWHGAR